MSLLSCPKARLFRVWETQLMNWRKDRVLAGPGDFAWRYPCYTAPINNSNVLIVKSVMFRVIMPPSESGETVCMCDFATATILLPGGIQEDCLFEVKAYIRESKVFHTI